MSVSHLPVSSHYPAQARAMDKSDIRSFHQWHRAALRRAKRAGFDLVYIYCRPGASLPGHFLSRELNRRTDEYGGSLENRARLLREMLADALDTVGDSCAVALRFTVDDPPPGPGGELAETHELIEMLAEVPDLWDVNIREWRRDSMPSRFGAEGGQEDLVALVKKVTSKPVVGVGRFTSPDTMVAQIRRGVLDFIGAARPSIADPFLPQKIEQGQIDDIRECIGCNVCVSADFTMVPMRCTQNPTAGEEWRKGWHPERIPPRASDDHVLIVGAGPAGLECARALGERGYEVTVAEAAGELGGRVAIESRLPGLAEWRRVQDHRVSQLARMPKVALYRESPLDCKQVLEFGFPRVVIATGAHWRRDGIGRSHSQAIPGSHSSSVYTPDDVVAWRSMEGPIVVYDDDHYYLGSVIAEQLATAGHSVTLVTPAPDVAAWSVNTLEQRFTEERLHAVGVRIIEKHQVLHIDEHSLDIAHAVSGRTRSLPCTALVLITMRLPNDSLYRELVAASGSRGEAGVRSIARIGDCLAPSTIAAAVYSGHRYARELDCTSPGTIAFERE